MSDLPLVLLTTGGGSCVHGHISLSRSLDINPTMCQNVQPRVQYTVHAYIFKWSCITDFLAHTFELWFRILMYPLFCLSGRRSVCMALLPLLNAAFTSSAFHLVRLTVNRYICIVNSYTTGAVDTTSGFNWHNCCLIVRSCHVTTSM